MSVRGGLSEEVMPLQPQGRGGEKQRDGTKHATEETAPSRTHPEEAAERL